MSKTALVLSGGGAKGAFQVGVMRNIIGVKGFRPERIYGTSTGALQAAGYAHLGIERLEREWLKLEKRSDIMTYNWWPHILTLGLTLDGIYSMEPLRKRLKILETEPREVGVQCEVVVTKVDIRTGELHYVPYTAPDFLESVLASCSIPVINPPVNGCVDGGVRDQTPIAGAIRDGFKKIVCIITNPLTRKIDHWEKPRVLPMLKTLIRVADDILAFEAWLDEIRLIRKYQELGVDITVYAPDKLLIQTQEYDPVKIRATIEQGFMSHPVDLSYLSANLA